ncbi:hypothetical protein Ddc_19605 [Ditylenchus destructor]|nr:hypothetical protein Ddc_19605 [Ditylenchus destructor]
MATMDNGTMVEAFKYLNYSQLAKNGLVSKRFCNLIRTHRNYLALLHVDFITMGDSDAIVSAVIKIFNKELTPDDYNEWIVRNGYSKQVSLEGGIAEKESTQNVPSCYHLGAYAYYKGLVHRDEFVDRTTVFSAQVELNDENWPVFQHFVRLATDPFIYIECVQLTYQNDVLNLLTRAINSDRNRLQCKELEFFLDGNSQIFMNWIKDHVRCNECRIYNFGDLNHDEEFLDFIVTGVHCTSSIVVRFYKLTKVVANFVQKFVDLKNCDEYKFVQSIKSDAKDVNGVVQELKHNYPEFLVNEEKDDDHGSTEHVFEFINNDIEKKLQLTSYILDDDIYDLDSYFSLDITDL